MFLFCLNMCSITVTEYFKLNMFSVADRKFKCNFSHTVIMSIFPWKDRMQWFLEPQSFLKSMTCTPQNHNRTMTLSKMAYSDNPEVASSYSFQIYAFSIPEWHLNLALPAYGHLKNQLFHFISDNSTTQEERGSGQALRHHRVNDVVRSRDEPGANHIKLFVSSLTKGRTL